MSQTTTLANLQPRPQAVANIGMNMESVAGFESMQRVATLFSKSSIVPKQYQGNIPDCFIAVDMAIRMGANPLMVCQNLYIVHGNPAWSAQFLIATFNKSGRFSAIRYEFQGKEGEDDWGCRAVATELATKEKLVGPLVTIGMAKKEGWYDKKDKYGKLASKWQSIPEMMLRYRAAAWFVRTYAPEIAMGLQTREELEDRVIDVEVVETSEAAPETTMEDFKPKKKNGRKKAPEAEPVNQEAGEALDTEVIPPESENPAPEPAPQPQSAQGSFFECPIPNRDGVFPRVTLAACADCPEINNCDEYADHKI